MIKELPTAGLLWIQNRKLLLAYSRNKECFYLPGGKVNPDESTTSALCREIEEELNVHLDIPDLHFYTHITAPAYGEENGLIMKQDCFLVYRDIKPIASAEIGELRFFTLPEYLLEKNTAPGAIMIMQRLRDDDLID